MPLNQPTPWWQLPNMGGALPKLQQAAPAGEQYDPTNFSYRNQVGSPTDLLAQRTRDQGLQDQQIADQRRYADQAATQSKQGFETQQRGQQQQIDMNNQAMAERNARQSQITNILGSLTTATGGMLSPSSGGAPLPQVGGPPAPSYQSLDASSAAQNAEFGKLKAKSGQLGQSALSTLRSNLAGRGILGSGGEGRGLADIVAGATNPLSDLNTAALHENVGIGQHNADLAQQSNLAGYQGSITQRGQNMQQQESQAMLAQAASRDRNEMLLNILRTMSGGR